MCCQHACTSCLQVPETESLPPRLRMLNGSWPYLSTPIELTRPKRFTLRGVFLIRVVVATRSVCSGPFLPFHLAQSSATVKVTQIRSSKPS